MELLNDPALVQLSPSTRRVWIEIPCTQIKPLLGCVALHPEGVDRNLNSNVPQGKYYAVALHPEGVDRNRVGQKSVCDKPMVALHPEGVDRNID